MTAIVMVDGIAYTRKEGVPCYDSGLGWRECQSDESHLAGALVDAQDELATLRAQLAGVREKAEKLERYIPVEGYFAGRAEMEKCDWGGWCYFDDVLAALGGAA